ncbi:MAG TPA: MlaD family protein [Bordetella sp.]
MADQTPPPEKPAAPAPVIVRRRKSRISWIWLVPLVAALAGLSLVVRTWMQAGPEITISFSTAEGLVVGQTQVRYKNVVIGVVNHIHFNHDRSKVLVDASLNKESADIAREGTRFWVVRPRLGFTGVSGLGTLLSGAYIGVDIPQDSDLRGKPEKLNFQGLETPPAVTHDLAGRHFTLKAADLGSLDIGSPVYFRRISVGRVVGYKLDEKGDSVDVDVFVDAPNDRYVTQHARFWNASGVDVSVNADGLKMRTESLVSLAIGGLAFETPDDLHDDPAATEGAQFKLYDSETEARSVPRGLAYAVRMRFDQSVRGLAVGAPVDFQGITLGTVSAINIDFDPQKKRFYALVDATLYPERLGNVLSKVESRLKPDERAPDLLLSEMVKYGLRAQLRPANLLTGQLFVVLDSFPNTPPVDFVLTKPPMIPTVPGQFDQLQEQVGSILSKISKVPFDQIGTALRDTLTNTSSLMAQLDKQVTPEARGVLRQARQSLESVDKLLAPDAGLATGTQRTMQELDRAARSLRALADYLQANPESLLRGRGSDPIPGAGPVKN